MQEINFISLPISSVLKVVKGSWSEQNGTRENVGRNV